MHAAYDWKLERLSKAAAKRRVSPLELANAYAMLGNKNETIRYLEQCYQEHEAWLVTLQSNPNFDFLHSDRRYQKIVSQMGLPPAYN